MDIPVLTKEELQTTKASLLGFTVRVSWNIESSMPEEVQILPEITELLFRFSD